MSNGKCKYTTDDIADISKQVAGYLAEEFLKKGLSNKNKCKKCGHEMIRDGNTVLLSLPAQYPYKCEQCGYTENFYR